MQTAARRLRPLPNSPQPDSNKQSASKPPGQKASSGKPSTTNLTFSGQFPASRRGVTLTELLLAIIIITIGVLGGMATFKYVSQAISQSRLKTIATNLAQEEMEVLKNKSYFQLLVTTAPATSAGYDPNFVYDTGSGNYAPETITVWGLPPLTRAVNVDYASVSGTSVSTIPYTSNDPGMKKITVYVYWTERGTPRKVQMDSYYQNPNVSTLNTGFKGQVTVNGAGTAIGGAAIQVIGMPKWQGTSDSLGNYSFQVAAGTYSLVCSSTGFFSNTTSMLNTTSGSYTTSNFSLTRIASGTVTSASLYTLDNSLRITQVVASTVVPNGYDVQYVELFNPTTSPINVGSGVSHSIKLNFTSQFSSQLCNDIGLTYVSTYVAPGRYYLIANTNTFVLGGVSVSADAYYTDTANSHCSEDHPVGFNWSPPGARPILMYNHTGTVWLTDASGATLDAAGWTNGSSVPSYCETNCIPLSGGLLRGDQIIRFSTACAVGTTYGRAYDTADNQNNFYYNNTGVAKGLLYRPFSAATPTQTVLSGKVSTGAYVFADDGNSAATISSNGSVTGPQGQVCPISSFTLVGVATGTWNVTAVCGSYSQTISSIVVSQGLVTSVPNGSTFPSWPVSGFNYTALTSSYTGGFASGFVYGARPSYSSRLPNILIGSPNGIIPTRTDSQGFYILSLPTGTVVVAANYGSDNANYITGNADATITQGAVTSIPDFHLAQGGTILGYVTSGTGALPYIAVQATLGGAVFNDTTDNTGYFYIFVSTSATPYSVTPVLDPLQSYTSLPSNPLISTVTLPGSTVFAGTITVIGAMGTISGSVRNNGSAITSGVLVVASTAAVPDPPATIFASSAPALAILYSVSSEADGTYRLDVRSSTTTTYNMRAFYPVVDIKTGAVSYTSKPRSGVSVGAGAEVSGQNFTWP